ncbi:hypothetical protein HN681_04480 [archaeon]|jgi:hypothetical protein|nr:hypothetical protein [archaeon]MBT3731210.1 hypothetical protein [archaeon]MBT4670036.1 hypothetical protein [archaeon]MBT5287762.1 hypothetical protein [archaeon]MBT7052767.1 hypothetical protein [archaeon]
MEIWKISGIILALILIFIFGFFYFRESPKKFYRKAKSLHREGEDCYEAGDVDLAEEYYQKANDCRKRAGELE